MATDAQKQVVFIQNARPPLRDETYTLKATQTIPEQNPGQFSAQSKFVVQGERFTIRASEIGSVFPPDLASGAFDRVLPHVVFTRRTLPWERSPGTPGSKDYLDAPWLAVLVCDDPDAPKVQSVTVQDLVTADKHIVLGSGATVPGKLSATTLSYGPAVLGTLGYGEAPGDPCNVIDLPLPTFNRIAPAAADVEYLAHVREVDTSDGPGARAGVEQYAVVVANRITPPSGTARAFLISLEGMADYLPSADGAQSSKIDPAITTVRLLVYRSWSFTNSGSDEALKALLVSLNAAPPNGTRTTTLTLPIVGTAPRMDQVAAALAQQAAAAQPGSVTKLGDADATVLVQNALLMGYVPLEHHLRGGGTTVSFYRGPLVPLSVSHTAPAYYSCPDAANGYNPQTGLFDVSYGAAWQLGQLLALQSAGMSNALYQWKRTVMQRDALATEQEFLKKRLGDAFPSVLSRRALRAGRNTPPPDEVAKWFGNLGTLQGVPFNYLVPDERMLPPESIRFFYVDQNWIDALVDGAFSIGRTAASDQSIEALHAPMIRRLARARTNLGGKGPAEDPSPAVTPVTGLLIRSQAINGWPNLRVVAFSDTNATVSIPSIPSSRLARDTLLCLFGGEVAAVHLGEPPEQLYHGVEGTPGAYYTMLRSVSGAPVGTSAQGSVTMRADNRTVKVETTADTLKGALSLPHGFTSAEFALEMIQGGLVVEYHR